MSIANRTAVIAVRIKPKERRYLEREATERGLKLSEYLRAILLPPGIAILSDGKNSA